MRESAVERRLSKEVKALGGMSIKIMPVVAGTPDRLVLLPGGRAYFVETKTKGGRLRPIQRVWHERAAEIGFNVAVLSSTQDIVEWLETVCEA